MNKYKKAILNADLDLEDRIAHQKTLNMTKEDINALTEFLDKYRNTFCGIKEIYSILRYKDEVDIPKSILGELMVDMALTLSGMQKENEK